MQQTGSLATAEKVEQPGPRRIDTGRHGQTSEDHARDNEDQDRGIAKLLQGMIGAAVREFQAQMVDDVAGQTPKVPRTGNDIAPEMPVDQAGDKPHTPGQDEDPGEKEMNDPPGCEVVGRGDRRPLGEGLIDWLILRSALAQQSSGIEFMTQKARYADDPAVVPFRVNVEDCIVELLVAVSCLRTEILLIAKA